MFSKFAQKTLGLSKSLFQTKFLTPVPNAKLSLHEYQAARLLSQYNLPVLMGEPANNPDEAYNAAVKVRDKILSERRAGSAEDIDYVIKAQILAGGRGLGKFKENDFQGGVHLKFTPEEIREVAKKMLGKRLVTKQSGAEGKPCNTVYVVERVYMRKELYLSVMLDRSSSGAIMIASSRGGTSIEEVDKKFIHKFNIDLNEGLSDEKAELVAASLELPPSLIPQAAEISCQLAKNVYKCFIENDASLIEFNPLAVTHDKRILICDCKVNVDENARFRHEKLFENEDISQKDPKEIEAEKYELNYIRLDGNIGCMVNGAGLAMATMDLIKHKGGAPANFLDVGGKASGETVAGAMKILNDDPQVEAILVNIFAGITRCDIIALGMIQAILQVGIRKPIVLRLKGTNIEQAKQIISDSGFNMFFTENLEEAAERAVKMAQILKMAKEIKVNISLTS